MENRKLIDRDEIYFLVFFSNFFIGMLLLTIKYNFDSIRCLEAQGTGTPFCD